MRELLCSGLRGFTRDTRGAASIELAIGAVALLGVSALCFDLYSRVGANTSGLHMTVAMADYLSRDAAPDGDELAALGTFLFEHELGIPADLVFVLSAFRQPPGDPRPAISVLWSDNTIRIGDTETTSALAGQCARYVTAEGTAGLPEDFRSAMVSKEVVVVAEVCARLRREGSLTGRFVTGDLYVVHALPARDTSAPPTAPVYAQAQRAGAFASGVAGGGANGRALFSARLLSTVAQPRT